MRWLFFSFILALSACGPANAPAPATTTPLAPSAVTTTTTSTVSTSGEAVPVWDAASARSWDRNLLALMPQIDACIAQSPQTRMITYAGNSHGAVLVRMQGDQAVDCRVNNGVAQISAHSDALNPPGDGDAEFVRGPGANPGGECYQAPEVRDASGNVLGWMIDPEGC
ncbi:MAG: hypothetical protein WAU68_11110 [Vitreimonas sp.]